MCWTHYSRIAEACGSGVWKKLCRAFRAVAGSRGSVLIINLPGGPGRSGESKLFCGYPHALEVLQGRGGECASRNKNSEA